MNILAKYAALAGIAASACGQVVADSRDTVELSQKQYRSITTVHIDGFQETPAAIFTTGKATLRLIDHAEHGMSYTLKFNRLQGAIESSVGAHIHFGQPGLNGGIVVFLCGTQAVPGPPGTPQCTSDGRGRGSIQGVITAQSVLGIDSQNFPANDLNALRQAIRRGAAYVNVHTDAYPSGEIRGNF